MQGTLFEFGITKEVKSSSGRSYDVTASMPLFVKDSDVSIQCEICNEKFKSEQYLDIHIFWKHNRSHKAEESKRELEIDTGLQKLIKTCNKTGTAVAHQNKLQSGKLRNLR